MEKEVGFTKGPWKSVFKPKTLYSNYECYEIQYGNDGECISEITHGKENSDLMAAAPEMYEALKELEESSEYWSEYDAPLGIVDRIKSAIKKAEGKS